MKKVLVLMAMVMLLSGVCYATQTQRDIMDEVSITKTATAAEADVYVGDAKRVSFFVVNSSNLTTEGATCSVTAAISKDGITWQDIDWSDVAGGSTKQTSETLGVAGKGYGTYYAWFDNAMTMPILRFRVVMDSTAASGLGAADYNKITITVVEEK